jgi:hypothetical protein
MFIVSRLCSGEVLVFAQVCSPLQGKASLTPRTTQVLQIRHNTQCIYSPIQAFERNRTEIDANPPGYHNPQRITS